MNVNTELGIYVEVDYRRVADTARFFGEKSRTPEPGWVFQILGARFTRVAGRIEKQAPSVLAEGGGSDELVEAVAIAVDTLKKHFPKGIAAEAVHTLDGSRAEFDKAFQGAFDLARGSKKHLPKDLEAEHR